MNAAFAGTAFLSAAMAFALQPFVGRLLVSAAGGGPGVWNACLVYFQTALVLGYLTGHFLAHAPVRVGGAAFAALSLGGAAWASWTLSLDFARERALGDARSVLIALAWMLGPISIALAASATLLQTWAARASSNPYRLYAASNLGSFAALLAYPTIVEPFLRLQSQRDGFVIGLLTLGGAMLLPARYVKSGGPTVRPSLRAERSEVVRWLGWSALPSALLVAATQHLSIDVAPAPLIWLPPLASLLLASTLAFADVGIRAGSLFALLPWVAIARGAATLTFGLEPNLAADVLSTLTALFVAAWACYAELHRLRPEPARLTAFYLWLAVGGAVGGCGVALLSPQIFESLAEWPFALLVVLLAGAAGGSPACRSRMTFFGGIAFAFGVCGFLMPGALGHSAAFRFEAILISVAALLALYRTFGREPGSMLVVCVPIALIFVDASGGAPRDFLRVERTFFGVHRVAVVRADEGEFHALLHGSTIHGWQRWGTDGELSAWGYYHPATSLGQALGWIRAANERMPEVAVVGLGAGGALPYREKRQRWTFLEIDPSVVRLARDPRLFRYVERNESSVETLVGDGRRLLVRMSDRRFDAIFLDAFSGDAVPTHLLTMDAFRLYRERLKPGGAVIVHVTNWFVDLPPVVGKIAERLGWAAYLHEAPEERSRGEPGPTRTRTMIVGDANAALLNRAKEAGWRRCIADPAAPLWEDDYCDLWSVLRWGRWR